MQADIPDEYPREAPGEPEDRPAPGAATVGQEPEAGVLYIVPTPLGHLGDLSPRAAHILGNIDVLLAEDTRVTRKLLTAAGLRAELQSCHDHNERQRVTEVSRWLQEGRRVALVSDAGTPLVSDPGYAVVRGLLDAGHRVVALPGPVAATTALCASGLPPDRFSFVGFLPRKRKEVDQLLQSVRERPDTLLFYCSCHRLGDDLAALQTGLGDRRASASRDLSKRGELHVRGTLSEVREKVDALDRITGEWTVCVEGAPDTPSTAPEVPAVATPLAHAMLRGGLEPRAVRDLLVEALGLPKKVAYELVLAIHATPPSSR